MRINPHEVMPGPREFPQDFDLPSRIVKRAAACAVHLSESSAVALAAHATAILRENPELHLTTITRPEEFLERHIGEAFEGAAMLEPGVVGWTMDLGSGNGYPGIPIAAARPDLRLLLAEASSRRAAFLRTLLREIGLQGADVLEGHVQRPSDLSGVPPLRLLTSRAMGGWAKILPRLGPCLASDGELLIWAGPEMETVSARTVWRRMVLQERRPLPGRDQSWVWRFRPRIEFKA